MKPRIELTPWSEIKPLISVAPGASVEEKVAQARELGQALPSTLSLKHGAAAARIYIILFIDHFHLDFGGNCSIQRFKIPFLFSFAFSLSFR